MTSKMNKSVQIAIYLRFLCLFVFFLLVKNVLFDHI